MVAPELLFLSAVERRLPCAVTQCYSIRDAAAEGLMDSWSGCCCMF